MEFSVQGMTYGVVLQELYKAPVPVACAAAYVDELAVARVVAFTTGAVQDANDSIHEV